MVPVLFITSNKKNCICLLSSYLKRQHSVQICVFICEQAYKKIVLVKGEMEIIREHLVPQRRTFRCTISIHCKRQPSAAEVNWSFSHPNLFTQCSKRDQQDPGRVAWLWKRYCFVFQSQKDPTNLSVLLLYSSRSAIHMVQCLIVPLVGISTSNFQRKYFMENNLRYFFGLDVSLNEKRYHKGKSCKKVICYLVFGKFTHKLKFLPFNRIWSARKPAQIQERTPTTFNHGYFPRSMMMICITFRE